MDGTVICLSTSPYPQYIGSSPTSLSITFCVGAYSISTDTILYSTSTSPLMSFDNYYGSSVIVKFAVSILKAFTSCLAMYILYTK